MSDTLIRIALPLPMDVAATIMTAVGSAYPNAKLCTDTGRSAEMVLSVSDADRYSDADLYSDDDLAGPGIGADDNDGPGARVPASRVGEAELVSVDENSFVISAAEEFGHTFAGLARGLLDEHDAVNYLEITMVEPVSGDLYPILVCRPGRPSPHRLRAEAEARAERYAEALRGAGIDPDTI